MKTQHGDLRVWWIPQVPMKAFIVKVANIVEAKIILDTLAEYDKFQFENGVKGDYSNTGNLHVFDVYDTTDSDSGSWIDWYDTDGNDIDNIGLEIDEMRKVNIIWEGA